MQNLNMLRGQGLRGEGQLVQGMVRWLTYEDEGRNGPFPKNPVCGIAAVAACVPELGVAGGWWARRDFL